MPTGARAELHVVARFIAKRGYEPDVERALLTVLEPTRGELGGL